MQHSWLPGATVENAGVASVIKSWTAPTFFNQGFSEQKFGIVYRRLNEKLHPAECMHRLFEVSESMQPSNLGKRC